MPWGPRPVSMKCRTVSLSENDWAALSALMVEAFPTARYYGRSGSPYWDEDHPELRQVLHPAQVVGDRKEMHFDEGWDFVWKKHDETGWWTFETPPFPSLDFSMDMGVFTNHYCKNGAEAMSWEVFQFNCRPGNKEDAAVARKFYSLVGKVATNKGLCSIRCPGYETIALLDKRCDFWVGHDALRWAREDPRRLLFPQPAGWAVRPVDD